MTLQGWVTVAALAMSFCCFVIFLLQSWRTIAAKPSEPARQMVTQAHSLAPASVGEMTDLVKALASLSDSLSKAGPALTSLMGSILLLSIGAIASGALVGRPEPAKPAPQVEAPAPTSSTGSAPQRAKSP